MKEIIDYTLKKGSVAILAVLIGLGASSSVFALTKKDLRRINDQGAVEVVVVYLSPLITDDTKELSFEVVLDTHSVDLKQYELEKIAFLRINGGPEIEASGWTDPGGGGHHISGTLKFNAPEAPVKRVLELIIKNVGGIEERLFQWELPLG